MQQCGNYRILLLPVPPFCRKNSVKATFSKKELYSNWFDKKNLHGNEFLVFHTDCDMYVHLCYTNCKTKNNEKYFMKIVYSNVRFRFTLFALNFCETDFTNRSFLCKLNDFTRFLLLLSFLRYKVISRMFSNAQCGKTRNSLPRKFFFVKSIHSKVL